MKPSTATILALASVAFTGCIIQPSVPDYNATWPEEPELAEVGSPGTELEFAL